jgi:hypothetical protein
MSRRKVRFADALDIFAETAAEAELRDAAVAISVWSKQRKLGFVVQVIDVSRMKPPAKKDPGQSAADALFNTETLAPMEGK